MSSRVRPHIAGLARFFVAIALASSLQGGATGADIFDLTVETWVDVDPSGEEFGTVILDFRLDMSVAPGEWYLDHLDVTRDPVTSGGESLYLYISRYWTTPNMGYEFGPGAKVGGTLGSYWVWPDSPRGRFMGGEVTVYAFRYVNDGGWVSREEISQSVTFGFTIPRAPAAAPEPAAATSAAIAALAGGAFAARRRRRRRAAPAA